MASNIIRLGYNCNQNCVFCTVALDNERELTTGEVKGVILSLAKRKARRVTFTGGEPTLREDLPELIEFAKKSGIKFVELQTNGVLLEDRGVAEKIIGAGVDDTLVSLHSHKKEISEKLTGSPKTFARTLRGIDNVARLCKSVSISHVINSMNYRELHNFAAFIHARFPKTQIYFGLVRPNGNAIKNKWVVPKLSDIDLDVYNAFEYCKNNNLQFDAEGFPLCYMQNFEEHSIEVRRLLSKPVFYVSSKAFRAGVHQFSQAFLRRKDERCSYCSLNELCPGVWREYADIHGTNELFPVFVPKDGIVERIKMGASDD